MKSRSIFSLILLAILANTQWALAADITIARSFSKMTLGMGIDDLQGNYETKEIASSSLLPGERLFRVNGQFPGINQILCTFYVGKLFRIELSYSKEYSKQVPWGNFVKFVEKGYGEGWGFETPRGPVMIWNDGETSFVLEQKIAPKSPPRYTTSIVDDDLYNARQESCPARKFEA